MKVDACGFAMLPWLLARRRKWLATSAGGFSLIRLTAW
jgi:hypothetical protein